MARLTLILGVLATVVYLLDGFRFMLNQWRRWRNKGTWLAVAASLACLPGMVYAEDFYLGPADVGAMDASSCANAKIATFMNTLGNWGVGAGKISAGDTVRFCGTITTTELLVRGSGSAGNVITLTFESGAKITPTVCGGNGCLKMNGVDYITVDGGVDGRIASTDNGTSPTYGNQVASVGISAFPCSNCEIKNMLIENIYVHNDLADRTIDYTTVNAIKISGSNILVHDNVFHDAGWSIYHGYGNGDSTVEIYNNDIYNSSHGWTFFGNGAISASGFSFHHNHVHDYSNWDNTLNDYHHDGIHAFSGGGATADDVNIYDNLFDGGCGDHMTAHIFMEGGGSAWTSTGTSRTFNNIFICSSVVNGLFQVHAGHGEIYNNTIIGAGPSDSLCLGMTLVNGLVKNNAISGCRILISINASTTFNNVATDLNYNTYACQGATLCFNWNGLITFEPDFAVWKVGCGCDGNSTDNASLLLNSDGTQQIGSPTINEGVNLSGLGITALNSDYLGNARGAGSAWDTGAYEFGMGATTSPVVIARVLRWMEIAAFVTGMGWHFRKQVMAVSLAAIAGCGTLYQLAPRSYDTMKVVGTDSAVKVLTVFNHLTKPRG
jgi:hypothetical protein